MNRITIAVGLSLLFALESAFAEEPKVTGADGMEIAEQLLLQEDVEQAPAPQSLPMAPALDPGKRATNEPGDAPETESDEASLSAPEDVLKSVGDDEAKKAKPAGSLAYDMDTIDLLADAPAEPTQENAPAETSVANR